MAVGRADTYDQRAEILGRILTRNRVVDALRVIVPALGVLAFALLAGQIYLANLARQYGISGIRIDRGDIVVEAPKYSGTGGSGARYLVSAREARTPLDRSQVIDMIDATLEMVQPGGASYFAKTDRAKTNTRSQVTTAPGLVTINGSDGLEGTLNNVEVDSEADMVTSRGAVDLLLPDGTTIVADSMIRDGNTNLWTFARATVVVPDLPAAER